MNLTVWPHGPKWLFYGRVFITSPFPYDYIGQVLQLGKLGTQGAFAEKVTPDIDGFTDEPVVWWDVRVAKNTFLDDSR